MAQIKPLTPELQKIAETELGEVPARISNDLEALKDWLQQQPHLKARTDDQFLVQYLRGCKYSLEKAKDKIDSLYTLKTKFPEQFNVNDVTSERFRKCYRLMVTTVLPRPLNNNGPRIMVLKTHEETLNSLYSIEETNSVFTAIMELLLLDDPYACINGIIMIFDCKNITSNYLVRFTPSIFKRCVVLIEKSLPFRFKALHFINASPIFQSVYNVLYPILSEKFKQRVTLTNNSDSLLKHIPKEYLPIEYGGENGSIENIDWDFDKKFDDYCEYFKESRNYGTDEKLRLGKPIDFDSMFGMGGSFRKLDVD